MNIVLFGILLCAIVCQVNCQCASDTTSSSARPRPCNIAFRCSNEEIVQWATDGKDCIVFRNPCRLASTNCDRQNQYKKVLRVIPKNVCQQKCKPNCTLIFSPVCATYNGVAKTFGNKCELNRHICLTGETYEFFRMGEC